MTTKEKIEALDNLIGMVDDNHGTDYDEVLKSAKRSLEAWEKVIEEIKNISIYVRTTSEEMVMPYVNPHGVIHIIKKHLGEVENEQTER